MNFLNKKAAMSGTTILLIIVGVVVAAQYLGYLDLGKVSGTSEDTTKETSYCGVEDTTVTFAGLDAYNNSAIGGTHSYQINNVGSWQSVTDAATVTLSPGDSLKIYWGGAEHPDVSTATVPCSGTYVTDSKLWNRAGAVVDSGETIKVFNENNLVVPGDSTVNITLAANDVNDYVYQVWGTAKQAFAPHGALVIFEATGSAYDSIGLSNGNKVDVPTWYRVSSTANSVWAYEIPAIIESTKVIGEIKIDVSTSTPVGDTNDINASIFSKDYYFDNIANEYKLGYEDEDFAKSFKEWATQIIDITS